MLQHSARLRITAEQQQQQPDKQEKRAKEMKEKKEDARKKEENQRARTQTFLDTNGRGAATLSARKSALSRS